MIEHRECTCHLGHPPCSFCEDTPLDEEQEDTQVNTINPLNQLFAEFLKEYTYTQVNAYTEEEVLFYFEMSQETFDALNKHPENKPSTPKGTYVLAIGCPDFKLPTKIIGRLIDNMNGYWQVPITLVDLPKGKVFLRKIPLWKARGFKKTK